MIPVFTFEEHHEAFFLWHYAVAKGIIDPKDNILLHVDEHSDFGSPNFNQPLDNLDTSDLQELYKFTYNELNIANFIVPALYQGVFKKEYWVRHPSPKLSTKDKSIRIYFPDDAEQCMLARPLRKGEASLKNIIKWKADPKCTLSTIRHMTIDDDFESKQKVVLDIDLDYFSCDPEVREMEGSIEITPEQYDSLINDRYSFMRIFLGSGFSTQYEDGKYYVTFNAHPYIGEMERELKVTNEEILSRIDKLIDFLKTNEVEIQMVCVCRSRISGYTPDDQWRFIERALLERLGAAFPIDPVSIDTILEKEGLGEKTLEPAW